MTSSLVGSEMCIRDRLSSGAGAYGVGVFGCPGFHQGGRLRLAGHTPVSYTHLTLPTICSV
eukprot:10142918-Prorocentrum_lima.AAC.1